jgi:hypothetical protein
VIRRILALCVCVAALAGCRVDLNVDMTVEPDGTGTITLVATADAEVVAAVPTLAAELATDDIVAAGWTIDGPTALPDGGLTITLSHDFTSDAEATNLLNSLGPPFNQMAVTRNTSGEDTTTRLTGLLGLPDGFESFADEDLIAAVGSVPFGDQIAASGATPESSINAVIRAHCRVGSTAPRRTESRSVTTAWSGGCRRTGPSSTGARCRSSRRATTAGGPVPSRSSPWSPWWPGCRS